MKKFNGFFWNKAVCFVVKQSDETCAIADGKDGFVIPPSMNGMNLVDVQASVIAKGVTNTMDIQIRRVRADVSADMLGTKVTVGDEYSCSDGVVNGSYDDIATGDIIFVDVDAVHDTPATGLFVTLEFGN